MSEPKLSFFTKVKCFVRTFLPHYWMMNEPYSKHWDDLLNQMINDPTFKMQIDSRYVVTLDTKERTIEVWIENYPYGFATPRTGNYKDIRPSKLTISKFKEIVDRKLNEHLTLQFKNIGKK